MHKYVERGNKTQLRLFQFLQKSDKGQIFYWSRHTALGSGGCLVVCHHAQKHEKSPISDLFNLTPKYFLPLLHLLT